MRDRFDTLVSRWMKKRQGVDTDPLELRRSRIYILPTRLGLAYAAMVFAMVIGAMNYNNNLGLGLGFLLAGLGLVTMHHCHGNLVGLRLKLLATEPAFVGQQVGFSLLLENRSVSMRWQIELDADGEAPVIVDVPAMGSTRARLVRAATRRGRIELERFKAATRHPLGLFRAWAVVYPEYSAIAWPRPAPPGRVPPGVATDTGGAQDHARGDEDFAGLKPYEPGDGLSKIAWKTYARGQGLHTKQYAGTDVVSHIFDWDSLNGMDTEARLSQLCRWVLDACRDGEACGLRLPGTRIEPNVGNNHKQYCLTSLALFERPDRNG
jgi:uncharacterized protein (DUF58 family)